MPGPMNTMGPGMQFGFPDVCLTPVVVPVPIPYPNIAMTTMSVPFVPTVLVDMMPSLNMESMQELSQGDDAGVELGVASGMVMGPVRNEMGSASVINELPATTLCDVTGHNGLSPNCPGMTLVPGQFSVLVLS